MFRIRNANLRVAKNVWPVDPAAWSTAVSAVAWSAFSVDTVLHEKPTHVLKQFDVCTASTAFVITFKADSSESSHISAKSCRTDLLEHRLMKPRLSSANSAAKVCTTSHATCLRRRHSHNASTDQVGDSVPEHALPQFRTPLSSQKSRTSLSSSSSRILSSRSVNSSKVCLPGLRGGHGSSGIATMQSLPCQWRHGPRIGNV